MNATQRNRIRDAFASAQGYDRHARVQRAVARRLAKRIAALPLPRHPSILEIGCGTGFLTQALIREGVTGRWLITDIAPGMVERCHTRVGDGEGLRYSVFDGEYDDPGDEGPFDLVCSSLVMQWFDDPASALARMLGRLTPNGHCIFTTLAASSFSEWRRAHEGEGFVCGTPHFQTVAQLEAMHAPARCGPFDVAALSEQHTSASNFLHSLKAIGASTAAAGHRPLPPAALRRVMRRFEQQGASVTYEVVTGHYRQLPAPAG